MEYIQMERPPKNLSALEADEKREKKWFKDYIRALHILQHCTSPRKLGRAEKTIKLYKKHHNKILKKSSTVITFSQMSPEKQAEMRKLYQFPL
jgi:hypothetical protein